MTQSALHTDCLEFMQSCKDAQFDLAVVDPPYGIRGITGRNVSHGRGKLKNRIFHLKSESFLKWDVAPKQEYFDQLFRVSKNQVIWGGNYFKLPPTRGFLVWDKLQPFQNFSRCEYAWTSFDFPSKLFHFDNRYAGKIHPTQKPVALYKWVLSHCAKEGDTIFDSHLGSGSSRIAAYDLGLDFVGCEINKDYYNLQEARFKEHTRQLRLFEFKGGKGGAQTTAAQTLF